MMGLGGVCVFVYIDYCRDACSNRHTHVEQLQIVHKNDAHNAQTLDTDVVDVK